MSQDSPDVRLAKWSKARMWESLFRELAPAQKEMGHDFFSDLAEKISKECKKEAERLENLN